MPRARKQPDAAAETMDTLAAGTATELDASGNEGTPGIDAALTAEAQPAAEAPPADETLFVHEAPPVARGASFDDAQTRAAEEAETRAAEEAETRAAEEAQLEAAVSAPPDPAVPEPAMPAPEQLAPWPAGDRFVAGAPAISEPEPGHVRMSQASAATIRATNVDAQQSAVGRMAGSTITLSQGATGLVRGTDVRLEQGAVGAIAADHVELRDGFAFLVVARRVSGNVMVLLDWRALLALLGVLLVLGRLLRGRR